MFCVYMLVAKRYTNWLKYIVGYMPLAMICLSNMVIMVYSGVIQFTWRKEDAVACGMLDIFESVL